MQVILRLLCPRLVSKSYVITLFCHFVCSIAVAHVHIQHKTFCHVVVCAEQLQDVCKYNKLYDMLFSCLKINVLQYITF